MLIWNHVKTAFTPKLGCIWESSVRPSYVLGYVRFLTSWLIGHLRETSGAHFTEILFLHQQITVMSSDQVAQMPWHKSVTKSLMLQWWQATDREQYHTYRSQSVPTMLFVFGVDFFNIETTSMVFFSPHKKGVILDQIKHRTSEHTSDDAFFFTPFTWMQIFESKGIIVYCPYLK